MIQSTWRALFLLNLFLGIPVVAKSNLPKLPDPDFGLSDSSSFDKKNRAEPQDLLSELEGLLENSAEREAKNQLGLEDKIIQKIDPIPLVKMKPEVLKTPIARANKIAPIRAVLESVQFLEKENGHVLEMVSNQPFNYSLMTKKTKKQFIYFFENITSPKKFLRAYQSKEFSSPVALFTLGEVRRNKKRSLQLVIQMREFTLPEVVELGNKISFEFPKTIKPVLSRRLAAELPESSLSEGAFDSGYKGAPIANLQLRGTDIREALNLVLQSTGYNLVVSDEVKGKVGSLSLTDIPWDQAFHLILKTSGLGYVLQGSVLRVATLDELKKEREEAEKQEEVEPLRTVLIPVSFSKANDLSQRATPFLTKRGKTDVDARSNTIIVRDVDRVVDRLQKLFKVLDTQPPSISISAKFVEMTRKFSRKLGLGASGMSLAGRTSGIDFGVPAAAITNPGFQVAGEAGTINLSAKKFAALNAQLTLGESDSQVKVLANPTITVQQGEKGSITQGNQQTLCIAGSGLGAVPICNTMVSNLTLDVTPIVSNDGSISIDTSLLNEIPQPPAEGAAQLVKDTREVKTKFILDNGETAVLGGIFKSSGGKTDAGVPFLRSLPLLGYLFSQKNEISENSEILIFVTARILNPEAAFQQKL